IDDVAVACRVAEAVARERIGPAHGHTLLQGQGVAADPAAAEDPQVNAPRGTDARVATQVEEEATELVRPVRRDRRAHGGRGAALAQVVVAIVALEEERGPPDFAAAQSPVLDRRDVVEGAELNAVRRGFARA